MASFTPQEIEQFLQQFFDVVGTRQYVGARYVPLFGRKGEEGTEWDGGVAPYEPLTIVTWQGDSYTSRQYVPKGIGLDDTDYWVRTGNFNGQVEAYREEVARYASEVDGLIEETKAYTDEATTRLEEEKLPYPVSDRYGTVDQVLATNADGSTRWVNPVIPDATVTAQAVDDWLDAHPEATTTVQDGAITTQKLANGAVTDDKLADAGTKNRVTNVTKSLTGLYAENASMSDRFLYTPNVPNRLLTGFIKPNATPFTFTVATGYQLRVAGFTLGLEPVSISGWGTTSSMSRTDRYARVVIRRTNDGAIDAGDISSILTIDPSAVTCLIPSTGLDQGIMRLDNAVDALTRALPGVSDALEVQDRRDMALSAAESLFATNESLSQSGEVVPQTPTRIMTGLIRAKTVPVTIAPASGYGMRIATYDDDLSFVLLGNWLSNYVLNDGDTYVRVIVRRSDNSDIAADEIADALTISGDYDCLIPSATLLAMGGDCMDAVDGLADVFAGYRAETEVNGQFAMNLNQVGNYDEVWEYNNWMYPMAITHQGIRDRLFYGFTCHSGHAGIGQYDFDDGQLTKTIVKRNVDGDRDDHDIMAIRMLSNGVIVAAYSGGHNTDKRMFVRVGLAQESVDMMGPVTVLESEYLTSYAQLFEYGGRLWLFYRGSNLRWLYRVSDGITRAGLAQWSPEQVLVSNDQQMYCTIRETTEPGTLRLCCYTNPSANDTNIRMCFLHLGNRTLYDLDNATPIGMSATLQQLSVIIPEPTDAKVNRLFEAAITAPGDTKVLFCTFTNSGTMGDGMYYVYDNGTTQPVVAAGTAIWVPKAQSGITWCGTDKIVVGRGSEGRDLIEIYNYASGTGATLWRQIASNTRNQHGTTNYRTARPIVDDNQRVVMFWEGYYDPTTYTNFNTSARIYDIDNDEMLV